MTDDQSAELMPLVSREQMDNAFWEAVRMFVGRGKRHRAEDVSVGAGVHRRKLDCYRGYPIGHPDHRPLDDHEKWSIASFIGADLTNRWIAFMGQGAFNKPEEVNHDDTAQVCIDFTSEHARARHPDSPEGVNIAPCEDQTLRSKAAYLKAVA